MPLIANGSVDHFKMLLEMFVVKLFVKRLVLLMLQRTCHTRLMTTAQQRIAMLSAAILVRPHVQKAPSRLIDIEDLIIVAIDDIGAFLEVIKQAGVLIVFFFTAHAAFSLPFPTPARPAP